MTAAISDSQIIILEGADGTGKTTLAKELAKAQDRMILHAAAPTHDTWREEYINPLAEIIPTQSLVLDRWHIGEMVWPNILGRPSLFGSAAEMRQCHSMMNEYGAFTIILIRTMGDIGREIARRKEKAVNMLTAVEGQIFYMELIPSSGFERVLVTTLPTARELLGLT